MKDAEWKEYFALLSDDDMKIINHYMDDDMRRLKYLVNKYKPDYNNGNHRDQDLQDDAMKVLMESVISYNGEKAKFETFLIGNIKRSFQDWYRDNYLRVKRSPLLLDKDGKIVKKEDENGKLNPVQLQTISFDAPVSEGENDLTEKIASDFNIEDESNIYGSDEKVENFLSQLSNKQSQMLTLLMEGYKPDEVKDVLALKDREYSKEMAAIKANKNLLNFSKNINDGNYMEEKDMDRVIKINEAEDYRTDKYSLFSLLQDKKNGDINCTYILQREPFQWSKEEANRYFCRILSNLPIPEIVLCEQSIKGIKVNHLIDGLQRLSYAQAYKENLMKIGESGAERHLIEYREYVTDDKGNRILDEDGIPQFEIKVFDLIGKYYKDLPDELKKRFNNFNINVTKFFDCTDEQIADHLRDYNNHASMNKEQIGIAKISAGTAQLIKNISKKNTFFRNCGSFTDNSQIKGKIDRVVAEAIMLLFHRNDWRANLESTYKYVDENANEREFLYLNSQFNRLELALGDKNDELKKLFTPTSMPMWISVFDKFTTYNIDDSRFIEFLEVFNNELKDKFAEDFKNQQSKKKSTISGKIDLLVSYMNDFLHIDTTEVENNIENTEVCHENDTESETSEDETILDFVKDNADEEAIAEDVDFYDAMITDYFKEKKMKITEPIYQQCRTALIAIMAYACGKNIDDRFPDWISTYKNVNNFSNSQKINFDYMKRSFDKYVSVSA